MLNELLRWGLMPSQIADGIARARIRAGDISTHFGAQFKKDWGIELEPAARYDAFVAQA